MTPIKRKLLYIFRDTLLRLRISWDHGKMLTLSVGYHIDKTDAKGKPKWDGERCVRNTTHGEDKIPASVINKAIENLENKIDLAFLEFEKTDTVPSQAELKDLIFGSSDSKKKQQDFFSLYDQFLKEGEEHRFWANGTIKKLSSRKNLLLDFNKETKLNIESLDEDTLNKFVLFQTKNCISKCEGKDSYVNTTIVKNVNLLKWFLRWAERKGLKVNPAYKDYKPSLKTPEKPVIFLSWDELMSVYNHDFSERPDLEFIRDGFCLCCFTSMRYSDLANLNKADVYDDHILITTVKTTDTIRIDLNKYSSAILKKYENSKGEKAIPTISNQKMNVRLKEICEICRINSPINIPTYIGSKRHDIVKRKWELISTHCGRRTFICNALSLGIAPNIVMKWTGHSDYKSMRPYIDIADDIRKSSMNAFNIYGDKNSHDDKDSNKNGSHG